MAKKKERAVTDEASAETAKVVSSEESDPGDEPVAWYTFEDDHGREQQGLLTRAGAEAIRLASERELSIIENVLSCEDGENILRSYAVTLHPPCEKENPGP